MAVLLTIETFSFKLAALSLYVLEQVRQCYITLQWSGSREGT